jgi:hypothetical protein
VPFFDAMAGWAMASDSREELLPEEAASVR